MGNLFFRENRLVAYLAPVHGGWCRPERRVEGGFVRYPLLERLEAGQYVCVEYSIEQVGGGYYGLARVLAHDLALPEDMVFLPSHPEGLTESILQMRGSEVVLSEVQRAAVASFLRKNEPAWVWDNAEPSVRRMLSGTEEHAEAAEGLPLELGLGVPISVDHLPPEPEVKARRLVREAWVKWSDSVDPSDARALLEEALQLDAKVSEARCVMGRIALAQGAVDEAISFFEQELQLAAKPDRLNAHSYLAAIFRELGREGDAQRHAEAAMATQEHKAMPTKLSPEAIETIRAAIRGTR